MILLYILLLIIIIGLYHQTDYIGSSNWFRRALDYKFYGFSRQLLVLFLKVWPFYHSREFREKKFFVISVYRRSWKRFGTGYQWSSPSNRGSKGKDAFTSCWLGIHILYIVIEFHFQWNHEGTAWTKGWTKDWRY